MFLLYSPYTYTHTRQSKESPLKLQTRVIRCFPSGNGYAIGSIEGRVAIQYAEDKDSSQNFSFKCHRGDPTTTTTTSGGGGMGGRAMETNVYAVNDISFNKAHGTFCTAGSDGSLSFWDKDLRTRLKSGCLFIIRCLCVDVCLHNNKTQRLRQRTCKTLVIPSTRSPRRPLSLPALAKIPTCSPSEFFLFVIFIRYTHTYRRS